MPRAMNEASLRHLGTLFGGGSGLGMSDGQLLERFLTREGTRAERAFEILVERHGPMVQRVARSIARDRDLADDAFQAVFVTLAKRARSLWVRDSIGPWLHAVTVRVATRMRNDQARRRRIDAKAAALMPSSFEPGVPDDLGAALHEEIARLPEVQRLPIVLCLVEGLTHDQAADRLGWPVGTVRSRLARGRERLRSRLDRRGLAPSSGVLIAPGLLLRSGSEAIRGSLLHATVQNAVSATQGGVIGLVGTVPAGAIAAAVTLVKESSMIHRILVVGLMSAGVFAAGASIPAQSKQEPSPVTATARHSDARIVTKTYAPPSAGYVPPADEALGTVEGTVTFNGEPVSDATITFHLSGDQFVGTKFTHGKYRVDRVPIGAAKVTIESKDSRLPDFLRIPAQYGSDETSPLRVEIKGGNDTVDFDLTDTVSSVAIKEPFIAPEFPGDEIIEDRVIGPKLNGDEIVEERVVGLEEPPFPVAPILEGPARKARSSDPFSEQRSAAGPTPDQRSPFERRPAAGPTPDQRIESLERKLDAILDELRAIRGGEKPEGVQGGDNSD